MRCLSGPFPPAESAIWTKLRAISQRGGHDGPEGARCSSVVTAFAHGAMGRRIDPSWGGPTELFLVPSSSVVRASAHGAMGRRIDPSWGGPIELVLVPRSEM